MLVCVLIIGMVLFVVDFDWLFGVSPDDKSDDSSRVLASIADDFSIGFVVLLKVDILGGFSPDDEPDGSSRVLISLVAESVLVVALIVFDFAFVLMASFVWMVLKVELLVDRSPDDKPDGSSRVLVSLVVESFIGVDFMVLNSVLVFIVSFVFVLLKIDLLGGFSPDDKPDGSSRVLVPTSVNCHGCVFVGVVLFVDCELGILRYLFPSGKF